MRLYSPIMVEKKVKTKQTVEVLIKISLTNIYLHITITIQLSSSYCVHVIHLMVQVVQPGTVCVCVCVCVCFCLCPSRQYSVGLTFELHDLWSRYLASSFILTFLRSISQVRVIVQSSWSRQEIDQMQKILFANASHKFRKIQYSTLLLWVGYS